MEKRKSIAQFFMPLASHVASTHTLPWPVPQADPLTACLPQLSPWNLGEMTSSCHWRHAHADVLQDALWSRQEAAIHLLSQRE